MNDIVLNYIVQAILGGASGYITNDYAINMLFKEYTPFKIGGVIKKNREEFIENISSMVENDLINKRKLQEILGDDNFKIQFENLAADFYDNCIKEAAGSYTWDKIITDETDTFVHNLIIEHSSVLYELMIKNLNIKEFLNENQLNTISGVFYNAILELFEKHEDIVESMLLYLYEDNAHLTLNSIIDKNLSKHISSNIIEAIKDKIIQCDSLEFEKIIHLTGIDKAINKSIDIFLNKSVNEIINLNNDVICKVNEKVSSYINSDKGYEFIYNLCASIFAYGKKFNISIFELLDSKFEENLKLYIVKSIPDITDKTINWIKENNNEINKLLEDTIDEVINESEGLKAKLLLTIKNTYLKDLSKKYSIIDKLIVYVKSIAEPEKLSDYLSAKIIYLLNNITVKEIIDEVENNGLTHNKLTEIIISYLNNNLTGILNQSVIHIKNIKINKLFSTLPSKEKLIDIFKKIYSSQHVQSFLAEKLSLYADDVLAKELEDFIEKGKIKELSINLNKYIINMLKDNKAAVEKWIGNQIYTSAENFDIVLNNETKSYLNEKLFENYKDYSYKLKTTELNIALDQLKEIENISNSSSDYLRSYAINNTDAILKDSVKVIVTDNLNKLNDDELVSLANDFIGRELKPIMLFGGVLGVIAGLILAIYQNKALNPQEISIANMVLYAFVGFITNVIAINMIFKPYKENKLISKMPFLKNFSLGYIVKNQKVFAERTSHFIDSSLLNKKSINDLFEKHEENIKNNFINTAKYNDYIILKNILHKNKLSIVNKIVLFLKNKIKINSNKLCSYLYNKIIGIKLFMTLTDKNIELYKNYILNFINSKNMSKIIHGSLNSKTIIKYDSANNNLSKFINNFNENNIKNYIYNSEDTYKNFGSKKTNEIFNENEIKDCISSKISSLILSQENRDKFFQTSSLILNSSVNKNKTIEEVYDGKLKIYIDSLLPNLTEGITKLINKNIQNSKGRITLMVISEIKSQLGFFEKSMYTLMGGDEITNDLIEKITNVKIPAFLEQKKHEINNIISTAVNEKLYKTNSEVLYSAFNKLQLKKLVDNYMYENSEKIENITRTAVSNSVKSLEKIEINKILNLFYLDSIHTAFDVYGKELDTIIKELSLNIKDNENEIIKFIKDYSGIPHSKIFKDIQYESIEVFVNNLISKLNKNKRIKKNIDELINYFVKYYGNVNIGSIINNDEFLNSLNYFINNLVESDEFEKTAEEILTKTIDNMVFNNINFINTQSKDYLFNIFIEASINSVKRNLSDILKYVEFDKIVKEEIEKMEPKKIHEMFNSFGEKYFRKLMIYGFGGFIFGINVYMGITLTSLKIVSQLKNKD